MSLFLQHSTFWSRTRTKKENNWIKWWQPLSTLKDFYSSFTRTAVLCCVITFLSSVISCIVLSLWEISRLEHSDSEKVASKPKGVKRPCNYQCWHFDPWHLQLCVRQLLVSYRGLAGVTSVASMLCHVNWKVFKASTLTKDLHNPSLKHLEHRLVTINEPNPKTAGTKANLSYHEPPQVFG